MSLVIIFLSNKQKLSDYHYGRPCINAEFINVQPPKAVFLKIEWIV